MLIVALVLAVIGLAALVTAVVTSNEVIAWVCIAASVIGVILLIVDAIREKQRAGEPTPEPAPADDEVDPDADSVDATYQTFDADYPEEQLPDEVAEPTDPATEADKPSTG
ncbi:hypothetical protein MCHIJ_34800 [Mycolicibacterium chitae]|uniref:Transmembrane protein n=1 Tax=Mycolicibacterium chitae TaxID=1792 RepID=A0A3S4RMC4_MYCCI|nr:DUF3784 domain-containing protein [Mycolicibacterium chitae]MCV7107348.1 DUF3784 domain-containing protein [Mycolicibacterium chitae]BBZ04043.1 hypothetical protein MCHIJ_34800 [Mycolicibacterium chitae]VEG47694.1 transmembrane protein [Mycolicibacterium chitae]